MNKPPAPVAPVELSNTGDITPTGIVLLSKNAQFNDHKGNFHSGNLRIIKLTFGWKKYEVQMNGEAIFDGTNFSRFEKLSEAAEWAGF
jgi:hypothetical protein